MGLKTKQIILEGEDSIVYECFLDQILAAFSVNADQRKTSIRDRAKGNLPASIYNVLKKAKRILPTSILKKLY